MIVSHIIVIQIIVFLSCIFIKTCFLVKIHKYHNYISDDNPNKLIPSLVFSIFYIGELKK